MKERQEPVTGTQLEAMRATLRALPPAEPTGYTGKQSVHVLQAEIEHAFEQGYTVEQVAQMLAQHGLSLRPGTLQGYLKQARDRAAAASATATGAIVRKKNTRPQTPLVAESSAAASAVPAGG